MKTPVPHVVMVSAELAPHVCCGGLGVAVSRLAAQLPRAGVRCTVLTPPPERGRRRRARLAGGGVWRALDVAGAPADDSTGALRRWWSELAEAAVAAIRRLPAAPDLVVLHDNDTTLFPAAAARAGMKWPTLYWLHSLYDRPAADGRSAVALAIAQTSHVAVSAGILRDAIHLRWPKNLRAVQRTLVRRAAEKRTLCVDPRGCLPAPPAGQARGPARRRSGAPTVLFAGRADYAKGLGFLIEAARSPAGRQLRFAVTGDAPAGLGGLPRVEWLGWLTPAQLRAAMQRAGCVFAPSIAEGFGLAATEAVAAGVPVVGLPVGGLQALEGCRAFAGIALSLRERELLYELWGALLVEPGRRAAVWHRFRARLEPLTNRLVAKLLAVTTADSPRRPAAGSGGPDNRQRPRLWGDALAGQIRHGADFR